MSAKHIRKNANWAFGAIVIIALFIIFYFCKCEDKLEDVVIGLSSSFVVSSIFYFGLEYIPNIIRLKEHQESLIPRRKIAYRELMEYYTRIVATWYRIALASGAVCVKNDLNMIFSEKNVHFIEFFDLMSSAKDSPILFNGKLINCMWKDVIINEFEKAKRKGEVILDRYSDVVSDDVMYAIYMLQNHNLMGELPSIIAMFDSSNICGKFELGQCIVINENKYLDASSLISFMDTVNTWLEKEKSDLKLDDEDVVQLWK